MNIHDLNDLVRLSVEFKDFSGALADPTAVVVKVRKPDGTVVTGSYAGGQVVKDAVGKYHYDVTVDQTGYWVYRWEGTGAVAEAEEGVFLVRESAFD